MPMKFMSARLAALVVALVLAVAGQVGPAAAEKRVALVLGNGAYTYATPLANPARDAQAMAAKLRSLGFETIEGYDLDRVSMDVKLREFARSSRGADINIFFYAGHGMSVAGTNYLVPIDAEFADETALHFEAVPVDDVTKQMSYSDAVNLIFLDACRDNPLSRSLARSMGGATRSASVSSGLAEMKIQNPGKGLAIAFATSPGDVALDGEGDHSPFTMALLEHIGAENTDITEVFSKVTGAVYESTDQAQRPWLNTSLTGSVMLNRVERPTPAPLAAGSQPVAGGAAAAAAVPGKMDMLEEQKMLYELARDTGAIEDYQAYLDTFPNGLYANNARRKIVALKTEKAAAVAAVAPSPAPAQQPQFAAAQPAAPTLTRSINEYGMLVLHVTPALRAAPANELTESGLSLDRQKRGEIQSRLNAAGASVGGVDGQWGRGTRNGIRTWQSTNGLTPTGYFNESQLELLTAQTEGRFQPVNLARSAPKPRRKVVVVKKVQPKPQPAPQPQPRRSPDGEAADAVGRFFGGVLRELSR